MKRILLFFFPLLAGIIFLYGCTVNPNGGTIALSGNMGSSFRSLSTDSSIGTKAISATGLAAYPLQPEEPGNVFNEMVETSVAQDGSFSIDLPTYSDWIILVLDQNQSERWKQVLGFIAIKGGGNTLVDIPTGNITGDIDLGTLSQNGDEAVSSFDYSIESDYFTLAEDRLNELARIDTVYKAVKNRFVNYDPSAGIQSYTLTRFDWQLDSPYSVGQFTDPNDFVYHGWGVNILTNDTTSFTFDDLSSGAVILQFVPPAQVHVGGALWLPTDTYYGPASPLSSSGAISDFVDGNPPCYTLNSDEIGLCYYPLGAGYVVEFGESPYYLITFPGGAPFTDTTIPGGNWIFQSGSGNVYGVFDLAIASPLTDNGKTAVYCPSWKIEADAAGKVTAIQLKWFLWNGSAYQEITDDAVIEKVVGHIDMQLDDYTGVNDDGNRINECFSLVSGTVTEFENAWYLPSSGRNDVPVMETVNASFMIGDHWFFFIQ